MLPLTTTDVSRAIAFAMSMKRQRHQAWLCRFISDGPTPAVYKDLLENLADSRFALVSTDGPLGLWGHPPRQEGIDACLESAAALDATPCYVGLNNDDNYLTPGYLEQMVGGLQRHQADLVLCQMLHSYSAWGVVDSASRARRRIFFCRINIDVALGASSRGSRRPDVRDQRSRQAVLPEGRPMICLACPLLLRVPFSQARSSKALEGLRTWWRARHAARLAQPQSSA